MLSCETWSVPHANEQWETSNVSGNWCRQWTTSDLVWCHPPWPGSCQSWYVLITSFTPGLQRDGDWVRERDCLKPLIKMHSDIQIWIFLGVVNTWGLSSCMGGVCFALKIQFAYLWPQHNTRISAKTPKMECKCIHTHTHTHTTHCDLLCANFRWNQRGLSTTDPKTMNWPTSMQVSWWLWGWMGTCPTWTHLTCTTTSAR